MKSRPKDTGAEKWRPIPNTNGNYWASDLGRIWSRGRYNANPNDTVLACSRANKGKGYRRFVCRGKAGAKEMMVHTAVLLAWRGPKPSHMHCCRHLDGDTTNNRLDNLVWGTFKENTADRVRHGTACLGVDNPAAKLTTGKVLTIRRRAALGEPQRALAREYGISEAALSALVTGRTWVHLPTMTREEVEAICKS